MLALDACVQGALAPGIDAALARVLDRIGISLLRVPASGCCGALPHHLSGEARALGIVKRNIDVWWPHVDRDVEAIVVSASGCGVMVKDYGRLLQHEKGYRKRAKRIASLARDPVEVIGAEWPRIAPVIALDLGAQKVAFQSPCSLQHGLKLGGRVEEILQAIGLELLPVADPHLCCGSAGTVFAAAAEALGRAQGGQVEGTRTRPPGRHRDGQHRMSHPSRDGARRPVRHWIELLDERMTGGERAPTQGAWPLR
jgi:glycolate oxidase iron-sulfur subunit